MMGGGAFILLKAGHQRPESAKQAEIRLAGLLRILHIADCGAKRRSQRTEGTCNGCIDADFHEI
jgi:hypothetical protein